MVKSWLSYFLLAVFFLISGSLNAQGPSTTLPSAFPQSDYTPFGYIDNPSHTAVLNRSGIIRSVPPIGFGYWCRSLPWPYGDGASRPVNYLSFLHLSINMNDIRFHTSEDFINNKVKLVSRYHTKNMMSYDWEYDQVTFSARYFLAEENALVCILEINNRSDSVKNLTVHATNIYGYPEKRWWGCDGVVSQYNNEADAAVSKIWAYGDIFVLGADKRSTAYKACGSEQDWTDWITKNDVTTNDGATVRMPDAIYAIQSYQFAIPGNKSESLMLILARGKNEKSTVATYENTLKTARATLSQQLQEDERFYSGTPVLSGDWPDAWKHSWIYDWETLRMNVKNPAGIYKHHWDAMQIFTPRLVLGETGYDGMCLSYADVDLAKDMFRGAFMDAPTPNVPCSREDGSVNMICANGIECGTAPIWGLPFFMINSIYQRNRDDAWIRELYPYLKDFLQFWLENRTDEDGWLHSTCSWESGQDGSRRFLVSGHDPGAAAEFVRTVDIEAAMAAAMENMVLFAKVSGEDKDLEYWKNESEKRKTRVQEMYVNGWFRDFDARTGKPIILDNYYDIMMFLPLSVGLATRQQMEEIKPMFTHFRENPTHFLEWPSFLFPFCEAGWNAGQRMLVAEEVAKIGNRIYPRLDEQKLQPVNHERPTSFPEKYYYRIPGVSDEFWAIKEDNTGGCENYGWGATFPTLVIRNIIGFRESTDVNENAFFLAPAIPDNFCVSGKTLGITNLNYRGSKYSVQYTVKGKKKIAARLSCALNKPATVKVLDQVDNTVLVSEKNITRKDLLFSAQNGNIYKIVIEY